MRGSNKLERGFAVCASVAVGIALAACGGGDDDNAGDASKQPATRDASATTPASGGATDSKTVAGAAKGFYTALSSGDVNEICKHVSRKAIDRQAGGPGKGDCEKGWEQMIKAVPPDALAKIGAAQVTGVKNQGRQAIATVKVAGRAEQSTFVKAGGEWKFAAFGTPATAPPPVPAR